MKLPTLVIKESTAVKLAYYALLLTFLANIFVFVGLFQFGQTLKKQSADINHHIDCIINIFQVPNHTSFYLADPKTCHLVPISQSVSVKTIPTLSIAPIPSFQPIAVTSESSSPAVITSPSSAPASTSSTNPTPVAPTMLDKIPLVGGIFKTLGL